MQTYIPIKRWKKWIALAVTIVLLIAIVGGIILANKNNVLNLGKVEETHKSAYSENILTVNDLKEGDYIKYDTGVTTVGDNGVITCVVLYDSTSEYGVQIIPTEVLGSVTIGKYRNYGASVNEYNNAISKLNTEAKKFLNTKYASSARCVGSVPNYPESETKTYYQAEYDYAKPVSGVGKDEDDNYLIDKKQMEKLDILIIDKMYWFASRRVRAGENLTGFEVYYCWKTKSYSAYSPKDIFGYKSREYFDDYGLYFDEESCRITSSIYIKI